MSKVSNELKELDRQTALSVFWQWMAVNGAELKEDFKERLSERHVQNVTGHQKERLREVEGGLEK